MDNKKVNYASMRGKIGKLWSIFDYMVWNRGRSYSFAANFDIAAKYEQIWQMWS